MTTDKESDQDLIEHFVLPDDHLPYLAQNAIADGMETIDALLQLGCILAKFRDCHHQDILSRNSINTRSVIPWVFITLHPQHSTNK